MGLESSFKCCFAYRHEGRDGVSGAWPLKQCGLWAFKKKFLNIWGWVGQWRGGGSGGWEFLPPVSETCFGVM